MTIIHSLAYSTHSTADQPSQRRLTQPSTLVSCIPPNLQHAVPHYSSNCGSSTKTLLYPYPGHDTHGPINVSVSSAQQDPMTNTGTSINNQSVLSRVSWWELEKDRGREEGQIVFCGASTPEM